MFRENRHDLRRGSSPHTRGALSLSAGRDFLARDHPRIRGEHAYGISESVSMYGIIPAYAGST